MNDLELAALLGKRHQIRDFHFGTLSALVRRRGADWSLMLTEGAHHLTVVPGRLRGTLISPSDWWWDAAQVADEMARLSSLLGQKMTDPVTGAPGLVSEVEWSVGYGAVITLDLPRAVQRLPGEMGLLGFVAPPTGLADAALLLAQSARLDGHCTRFVSGPYWPEFYLTALNMDFTGQCIWYLDGGARGAFWRGPWLASIRQPQLDESFRVQGDALVGILEEAARTWTRARVRHPMADKGGTVQSVQILVTGEVQLVVASPEAGFTLNADVAERITA